MKNLKMLRMEKNLSQQQLANILHTSQQAIYKYENDITSPNLETLISIDVYKRQAPIILFPAISFPPFRARRKYTPRLP